VSTNPIADTLSWFQKAVPTPDDKHIHTQLGVHLEEVREMIELLRTTDTKTMDLLGGAMMSLELLSNHLKVNRSVVYVRFDEREEFLKEVCDQLVTSTGIAHMLGMDPVGGLTETNRSNFSKFDENGNPIFNENMKVTKGPNFSKADVSAFV